GTPLIERLHMTASSSAKLSSSNPGPLVLVMGVTGSGKTTLGTRLAHRLGVAFYDADDFHPAENRTKMAANIPLEDADRWPWLDRMADESRAWVASGGAVLACSALKQAYRERLTVHVPHAKIVYLDVDREVIARRLEMRRGKHAFIANFDRVLEGQFRDLEPPSDAIRLPATRHNPDELVELTFATLLRHGVCPAGRTHFCEGAPDADLTPATCESLLDSLLTQLGPLGRVLLVPPDITRLASGAGDLTAMLYRKLAGQAQVEVLPALGTHAAMTNEELSEMFPGIPLERFRIHDFRKDLHCLGEVPASFVERVSEGAVSYSIPCELNAHVVRGKWDRVITIGQLLPHEVTGISSHDKHLFVGLGGKTTIDRTHFLGAACNLERILGKLFTPVRDVLNYMAGELGQSLPVTHLMSVRAPDEQGALHLRGLFAGEGPSCFVAGARLARRCHVQLLERALAHAVVYLPEREFKSTWLGNKSVYRTRLALADGAKLTVIAPGVQRFGEDAEIDRLIRRHGYRDAESIKQRLSSDPELENSLSAAAHLIHGSSDGRFRICYAPGGLSREEVEGVGYEYLDLADAERAFTPERLRPGPNRLATGEEVFFIPNPALGLWATADRFSE
ncbi:MAG TPA: gluconokinase, GntK/IdnK-type, partial [Polyangiaceae bacterium]|nr:gluconokinase, GntK/IdnK-type [Polyangiaceae bacterium]